MAAPSKKFGVGIIGYGLSAKVFQIPFVDASPSFQLRAIVQRHGSAAREDNPGVTIYSDADGLIKDATIDVVVISTPAPTHFDLASRALEGGKHVIVEKPFAPTSAECDALIALATKKERLLSVFQNRRWDADFLTLQAVLADGALGRVVEFETHFDRYSPAVSAKWAGKAAVPGSDAVYDLGTHLLDQAVVLYGLPDRVTGFVGSQRSGATVTEDPQDAFTVLLHYDGGSGRGPLLVTAKGSVLSADTQQLRYWVRGEQGSFRKYHLDPQEPQIIGGMKLSDPGFGVEDASHAGTLTVSKDGKLVTSTVPTLPPATYSKYYGLLAAALESKGPNPVTPESARDVIRLVELAQQSSKEGKTLTVQ